MKTILNGILAAALILIAIIAVQTGLTYAFSFRIGELFSKSAITAVYAFCICRMIRKQKTA